MRRVYLDYAAATPVDSRVVEAMAPYLGSEFANPFSAHTEGIRVREALDEARARVAACIGAREEQIVFTSSATEANALAVRGFFNRLELAHGSLAGVRAAVPLTEHASVLDVFDVLAPRGLRVDRIGVTSDGVITTELLKEVVVPETAMVSVHLANSETGIVQRIRELSQTARRVSPDVVFHTDASQAVLWLDLHSVIESVDLLTLDSQKIYGPKGVGVLYVKRRELLEPLFGGAKALRPGTPNVPGIIGLATALEVASREREEAVKRVTELRDYLVGEIFKRVSGAVVNGGDVERLPNIVNVSFPGAESEFLAVQLDMAGIAAATKSACLSDREEGSYVVRALAPDEPWRAESALRFSLGRETTQEELDRTLEILTRFT